MSFTFAALVVFYERISIIRKILFKCFLTKSKHGEVNGDVNDFTFLRALIIFFDALTPYNREVLSMSLIR